MQHAWEEKVVANAICDVLGRTKQSAYMRHPTVAWKSPGQNIEAPRSIVALARGSRTFQTTERFKDNLLEIQNLGLLVPESRWWQIRPGENLSRKNNSGW